MRSIKIILISVLCIINFNGAFLWGREDSRTRWLNTLLARKQGDTVISAAGDLIFTREISGFENPSHTNLYRILNESDITYGNLEMSLNSRKDSGIYKFVQSKEFVWEIAGLGFNMLGLANNHQMDYGTKGLAECISILESAHIRHAGGGRNLKESMSPAYHRAGLTSIAFLSFYSEEFKSLVRSDIHKPSIATIRAPKVWLEKEDGTKETSLAPLERDIRAMEDAISIARRHADIVMVAIHVHWVDHARVYGIPDSVPPNQTLVFHKAVSAGADIILGTGPHVLRGIEIYKGRLIFYSLGNFIYQYKKNHIPSVIYRRDPQHDIAEEFETIVARMIIRKKKLSRIQLIPVVLGRKGAYYGCPRLSGDKTGKKILNRVAELSGEFGTEIIIKKWHGIVRLR
jgi:poly-gamma-glutamate capsule biosynthesis protein CapA/YwtB (metallophosphatase superfamily)